MPENLFSHCPNTPSGPSLHPPSKEFWMGTDDLGIDLFAQIARGTRTSLIIGFGVATVSIFFAVAVGCYSGLYGGKKDQYLMRLVDLFMTVPELPTMIVLGAFFGPSIINIIIVLSVFSWVRPTRIFRARVISIKEEGYIKMAKGYGGGFFYILKEHLLSDMYPLIAINYIRLMSRAVVAEASLSFLGLGDPTSKSWGLILNHAMGFQGIYFTSYWKWWVVFPLAFMILFVLCLSILSREVEEWL
ncbi:ABC transporter permease [Proteinivorax tanatarense]|uniref:ABC transporter permease n=1 Tax=Proteinivorax tanatarense TaxID=1260629 RepID=A0AAU7VPA1_9FIRM